MMQVTSRLPCRSQTSMGPGLLTLLSVMRPNVLSATWRVKRLETFRRNTLTSTAPTETG
jgi:hypothetical protein